MSNHSDTDEFLRIHSRTPALVISDPRGLAVRAVGYYRTAPDAPTEARVHAHWYDCSGRPTEQWDPRQFAHFQAGRSETPNQRTHFSLSGSALKQFNTDSGLKITLQDAQGMPRESWDGRHTHTLFTYDGVTRLVAVAQTTEGRSRITQRLTYSPVDITQAALNRCAQLCRQDDDAGSLFLDACAITGGVASSTRRFLNVDAQPDWPAAAEARDALLEAGPGYTTCNRFDATGEVSSVVDAKGNTQHNCLDVSGQQRSSYIVTASGESHVLLQDMVFDAAGRPISQTSGNGVISLCQYVPTTGRMLQMQATRASGERLQDLHYSHDPMGNIVAITDTTQPIRHFANQRTEPTNRYLYDSFYQLLRATGRQSANAGSPGPELPALQPLPDDPSLLLNYTQHYRYDSAGNMLELRHVNGQSNYTRRMAVAEFNNRSLPECNGVLPLAGQLAAAFDSNGNLNQLQPGQALAWDLSNQLQQIKSVQREETADDQERYVYDAMGTRVRKTSTAMVRSGMRITQTRYLPGLEIRTDTRSGEELHVIFVQAGRCAVRLLHWEAGKPTEMDNDQLRYGLDNHLGSCTLELDQRAQLLTREEYFPFGGTACLAARSAVQASYKFIRYSCRERDASGLYYYGQRYYAPWLQRWINPDPSGDIDGLNLYQMVSNNPVNLVDIDGCQGGDPQNRRAKRPGLWHDLKQVALGVGGAVNISTTQRGSRAELEALQRTSRDQERLLAQDVYGAKLALLKEMFKAANLAAHSGSMALASMEDDAALGKAVAYRATTIVLSNSIGTAAGIGAAALATPAGPGAMVAAGLVTGKLASVVTEKLMEVAGNPTSLDLRTDDLHPDHIKHYAKFRERGIPGKLAHKLVKMIPTSQSGAKNLGIEAAKTGGSKLAGELGVLVKIGIDGAKAGVELAHLRRGKEVDKVASVVENGSDLIRELYDRTQEVLVGMAHDSNDESERLGGAFEVTVGELLAGFGNAIENIENTRMAARAYIARHAA